MGKCIWKPHENLVGGFKHFEQYDFVNGKDDIPLYEMDYKTCLKSPTSIVLDTNHTLSFAEPTHGQMTKLDK